jgi:hypothetical protein
MGAFADARIKAKRENETSGKTNGPILVQLMSSSAAPCILFGIIGVVGLAMTFLGLRVIRFIYNLFP